MPCRPDCGACCDPVKLDAQAVEKVWVTIGPLTPQTQWVYDHWSPVQTWGDGVAFVCSEYDVQTRSCLAYDSRPPVCSGFPFYGDEPRPSLSSVCGFQAELGRTVLPIVEVR